LAPCVFIFIAAPHKKQEKQLGGVHLSVLLSNSNAPAFSRAHIYTHKQFSHSEKERKEASAKGHLKREVGGALSTRRLTSRFLLKLPIIACFFFF
jgi:hypothetical protein